MFNYQKLVFHQFAWNLSNLMRKNNITSNIELVRKIDKKNKYFSSSGSYLIDPGVITNLKKIKLTKNNPYLLSKNKLDILASFFDISSSELVIGDETQQNKLIKNLLTSILFGKLSLSLCRLDKEWIQIVEDYNQKLTKTRCLLVKLLCCDLEFSYIFSSGIVQFPQLKQFNDNKWFEFSWFSDEFLDDFRGRSILNRALSKMFRIIESPLKKEFETFFNELNNKGLKTQTNERIVAFITDTINSKLLELLNFMSTFPLSCKGILFLQISIIEGLNNHFEEERYFQLQQQRNGHLEEYGYTYNSELMNCAENESFKILFKFEKIKELLLEE
ncbi:MULTISPECIES: hypothetical protein [Bacillus cereus group]|uniref:hypothetical protein n=1 Tax=Bacillus cereus group TaxID=86661 RepID=UPI000B454BD3|nr:hypothetical protein [Bacillus thuringiensis]MED3183396.1 hypothetical protein [Bacillus thuringiensis]OTY05656.1 hypothetical protein BK734_22660 [Bacillus thuringiensis serovar kim]OUB14623.1 hypothetical protein BK733_23680 [Bacillus thuringiensis serovar xiaguangiensis]